MKKLQSTILVVLIFCFKGFTRVEKDTLRVLFIGNSYTYYNNLIQMVSLISDSMDTKLICTKSTLGAANLGEHWNELRGLKSRSLLKKNRYNYVVIQDNSMWPLEHADSVLLYGKKFCELITAKGAFPLLYSTWPRKATPEKLATISSVYEQLAQQANAKVVPVGKNWAVAFEMNKNIELYHPDGSHPSYLGSFLAALSFVKKITGKLPENLATVYNYYDKDGETFRIMQVSPEEIRMCKSVVLSTQ